jgi:putative two-component system response regulator
MTGKQERILIVDDEKAIRRLLHHKLSSEGYQWREAGDTKQVLDELGSNPIGLVMLDISMPGKSGIELLPEIRASYPDTAVVMPTAISDTSIAIQCMKQGAYDYITKPFGLDEVVLSLGRALEKRRRELENREYRQHLEQKVEE